MIKYLTAAKRSRYAGGKIQPLLLFLMGIGFVALGLRIYPAFIVVGFLFLLIGYRGYTCRTKKSLIGNSRNSNE